MLISDSPWFHMQTLQNEIWKYSMYKLEICSPSIVSVICFEIRLITNEFAVDKYIQSMSCWHNSENRILPCLQECFIGTYRDAASWKEECIRSQKTRFIWMLELWKQHDREKWELTLSCTTSSPSYPKSYQLVLLAHSSWTCRPWKQMQFLPCKTPTASPKPQVSSVHDGQ